MENKNYKVIIGILVAVIVAGVVWFYTGRPEVQNTSNRAPANSVPSVAYSGEQAPAGFPAEIVPAKDASEAFYSEVVFPGTRTSFQLQFFSTQAVADLARNYEKILADGGWKTSRRIDQAQTIVLAGQKDLSAIDVTFSRTATNKTQARFSVSIPEKK